MDDAACTRCHQAIDQHIEGKPAFLSSLINVTRFDQEHHPEFASAQKDPGHLKFSHYRHLTPGLVNDPRRRENGLDPGPDPGPGPARALPASRAGRRFARATRLRILPSTRRRRFRHDRVSGMPQSAAARAIGGQLHAADHLRKPVPGMSSAL